MNAEEEGRRRRRRREEGEEEEAAAGDSERGGHDVCVLGAQATRLRLYGFINVERAATLRRRTNGRSGELMALRGQGGGSRRIALR